MLKPLDGFAFGGRVCDKLDAVGAATIGGCDAFDKAADVEFCGFAVAEDGDRHFEGGVGCNGRFGFDQATAGANVDDLAEDFAGAAGPAHGRDGSCNG